MVGNKTITEPYAVNNIETIKKQDIYRMMKRSRETRDTSLFNKMRIFENRQSPRLTLRDDKHQESTGLLWDNKEDIQTIVRKGKLNKEGIKLLNMNKEQKHTEINQALKDMMKQKETQKQSEKLLSREQYLVSLQEMYLPHGLELF